MRSSGRWRRNVQITRNIFFPNRRQQVDQWRDFPSKRPSFGAASDDRNLARQIYVAQLLHPANVNLAVCAGPGKNQFDHFPGLLAALALRQPVQSNSLDEVSRLPVPAVVALCPRQRFGRLLRCAACLRFDCPAEQSHVSRSGGGPRCRCAKPRQGLVFAAGAQAFKA